MKDVRYVDLLPAEETISRGKGLNAMVMVDNQGEEVSETVRFFASDGGPWREIFSQEKVFPAQTHVHAYFHLPPSCFSPELWGGEAPEELSLWAGAEAPGPGEQGKLLFLEP